MTLTDRRVVAAISSGAACTSANPETSHVLRAIGVPDELACVSIRFGAVDDRRRGRLCRQQSRELGHSIARVVATWGLLTMTGSIS